MASQVVIRSGGGQGTPVEVGDGGATVRNASTGTTAVNVYYRDEPIDATTTPVTCDGTLAPGSTAFLYGTQYFLAASGQATITVTSPQSSTVAGLIAGGDPFRYDATRLGTLKTAIANRATTAVKIMAYGDSITEGDQVAAANRWASKLPIALRTAYGDAAGGLGFIPARYIAASTITNPITYSGTKTAVTTSGLANGRSYQMAAAATATLTFQGTGCDIIYVKGTTSSTFTYTIDGGAASSAVNANAAATAGFNRETVRGLTSGSHTIVITFAGLVFFEGIVVFDGDESRGFNMYEGGHAGFTSGDYLDVSSSAYDHVRGIGPHLAIIDFGTNDWGVGGAPTSRISPTQMGTNLKTLINAVRLAETDPSIILVEPARRGAFPSVPGMKGQWSDYIQAIRQVARDDRRVTLFDRQTVMGDQSLGGSLVNGDFVHPSAAGHTAITSALVALIQSA